MPRADVFFVQGNHPVCQDYGVAARDGSRAVLSDGCSSSPDTDIGARLICHAALRAPNLARDGARIIRQAENLREAMGLDPNSTDATLLALICEGDSKSAVLWGDGAFVARKRDGSIVTYEVCCKDSAPPYLSYLTSADRLLAYARAGFGQVEVSRRGDPEADVQVMSFTTSQDIERGIHIGIDGDFEALIVLTDGYRTGRDAGHNPVDPDEVLLEMAKVHAGNFAARRRFRMMARDRGWVFEDDFGVACITFLDP